MRATDGLQRATCSPPCPPSITRRALLSSDNGYVFPVLPVILWAPLNQRPEPPPLASHPTTRQRFGSSVLCRPEKMTAKKWGQKDHPILYFCPHLFAFLLSFGEPVRSLGKLGGTIMARDQRTLFEYSDWGFSKNAICSVSLVSDWAATGGKLVMRASIIGCRKSSAEPT